MLSKDQHKRLQKSMVFADIIIQTERKNRMEIYIETMEC